MLHAQMDFFRLATALEFSSVFLAGACDVLVLELLEPLAHDISGAYAMPYNASSRPFTLVLLPDASPPHAIAHLESGADRCMGRDSESMLIAAMIRALLHRCHGQVATFTEHGPLRFEHDTHTLFRQAERVPLTRRETLVASLLFRQVQRHTRPEEILAALLADRKTGDHAAMVSLYVHRINTKIRPHGLRIDFKRGYGYKLTVPDPSQRAPALSTWLRPVPPPEPQTAAIQSLQDVLHHAQSRI